MLTLSAAERQVCLRAARYIRAIAVSLSASESSDADACERYAQTLEAIVQIDDLAQLQAPRCVDIDQAAFIIEGIHSAFENADLLNAARSIERDLYVLDDLTFRLNRRDGVE